MNTFSVTQFNILAANIGFNFMPWFLHGVTSAQTRDELERKFNAYYNRSGSIQDKLSKTSEVCALKGKCEWTDVLEIVGALGYVQQDGVDVFPKLEAEEEFFKWENRKPKLVNMLRKMDSDIYSLVEFDPGSDRQHLEYFERKFAQQYEIHFHARKGKQDGNALFVRRSAFEVVDKFNLDYSNYGDRRSDRSALFLYLRHRASGRDLIVIATHLMRNPEDTRLDAVREHQVTEMNEALAAWLNKHNVASADTGVVIAGDFNATPDSSVIELVKTFGFKSTLAKCHDILDEYCTSKTAGRSVWIDYIFYKNLQLRSLVTDTSTCETVAIRCDAKYNIPNDEMPSDHIPIKSTFSFKDDYSDSDDYTSTDTDLLEDDTDLLEDDDDSSF